MCAARIDSLRSHGHAESALRLAVAVVRTMKQQQLIAQRNWQECQMSASSSSSSQYGIVHHKSCPNNPNNVNNSKEHQCHFRHRTKTTEHRDQTYRNMCSHCFMNYNCTRMYGCPGCACVANTQGNVSICISI